MTLTKGASGTLAQGKGHRKATKGASSVNNAPRGEGAPRALDLDHLAGGGGGGRKATNGPEKHRRHGPGPKSTIVPPSVMPREA